ncbi:MAG: hypothetical protein HY553_08970 [Elusimicrobia bacterium]|nr:hypothetical protein [Elusimicrobiota bacterium]
MRAIEQNRRLLGEAHISGVTEVQTKRGRAAAVLAVFEHKPRRAMPKTLRAQADGRTVEVPLVVKVGEPLRPQGR